MPFSDKTRSRLVGEGWRESRERFWTEEPCFYDLATIKTVLIPWDSGMSADESFFWKYESHPLPDFLDGKDVQVRRYKLHHSMNALLWYDHGDRKIAHE